MMNSMGGLEEFQGSVQRLVFNDPTGSFRVFEMLSKDGRTHRVSQRGPYEDLKPKDLITILGKVGNHERFGEQIYARDVIPALPETSAGLAKIISGPEFKGIGEKSARKLADLLQGSLVDTMEQGDPEGIIASVLGAKKTDSLISAWNANRSANHAHTTLASLGVGPALRKRIMEEYEDIGDVLRNHPYRLCEDIEGIGFATADELARKMNLPLDSIERLSAGLKHALDLGAQDGHTGLTLSQLVERTSDALNVNDRGLIKTIIDREIENRRLAISDNNLYQKRTVAMIEERIASHIIRQTSTPLFDVDDEVIDAIVEQTKIDFGLTDTQASAVKCVLLNPLVIVTGGPGTGKTKAIEAIIHAVKSALGEQARTRLMAPTGKAADRMSQGTGHPASTIHRALEYQRTGKFLRNEEFPLEADLIVLDEASMCDIRAFDSFIRACGMSRVVIVGDPDQLPSVDVGRVLLDIIESDVCPVIRFNEIFRQAAGSEIALGAASINNGKMPAFGSPGQSALVHIQLDDTDLVAERIVSMVSKSLPQFMDVAAHEIQVLSPGRNSRIGTTALNEALQNAVNKNPILVWGEKRLPVNIKDGHHPRSGDKIICTANDYEAEIFNGDIGWISHIEYTEKNQPLLVMQFKEKMVSYTSDKWSNIALSYALTIHKSQGSEYDIIIMPVTTSHYKMLKRNLIYTGITRAKKLCIVVGTKRALNIAISTLDGINRQTSLLSRIKRLADYS